MQRNIATYIPNKRHYLFCVDETGEEELSSLIREVQVRQASVEVIQIDKHVSSDRLQEEMKHGLSRQKMGTYLYIAVEWKRLDQLIIVAEDVGFTSEEASFIGVGTKNMNVFCCRCHGINMVSDIKIERGNFRINCSFCRISLSVSDHYSKFRNAYLGYSEIS
ncbi:hypothetical protein ACFVAD_22220 [Sutcliffiella sp. NPDC057660]|uniref:hypothetical protein n=1 Tax=Sutcliffiella sp. NPDC057660 TaxID=3346199 RepID=UPI0036A5A894